MNASRDPFNVGYEPDDKLPAKQKTRHQNVIFDAFHPALSQSDIESHLYRVYRAKSEIPKCL